MTTQFNKTHPGIHVTESNIPSVATTSTAKLLSAIAAGDPPDIFTEWWPEIGEFAADGDLDSMSPYLTGQYAGFEKWEYPVAVQGGTYKGQLYAVPMGLNSWALYYNKSMLAKAGITLPAHDVGPAPGRPGQRVGHNQRQARTAGQLPRLERERLPVLRHLLQRPQLLQLGREVRLRELQGRPELDELDRQLRQVPLRAGHGAADRQRPSRRRPNRPVHCGQSRLHA